MRKSKAMFHNRDKTYPLRRDNLKREVKIRDVELNSFRDAARTSSDKEYELRELRKELEESRALLTDYSLAKAKLSV